MEIKKLLRKFRRLNIMTTDTLQEKGIIKSHNQYQKFLVVSRGRSGSNFFMNLLQSHPNIRGFGELFPKQINRIYWGYPDWVEKDIISMKNSFPT